VHKILLLFLLLPFFSKAQTTCTPESRQKLEQSLERISSLGSTNKTSGELAAEIGQWLIGTPYLAKTLELPGEEKLVIDLMGVDCTTYLESVIALVQLAQKGETSMEAFERELELIFAIGMAAMKAIPQGCITSPTGCMPMAKRGFSEISRKKLAG
jgi:hypothetical protein